MRLFMSYARVDKRYCIQIIDTLDVHEVWFDQRLHAGQRWWDVIRNQLDWCEGFIYLLSPDSVSSKYCKEEFQIAKRLGKHVFPVLIHGRTPIPVDLQHVQYVDLSKGLTPEAVKELLNSIYIAEKNGHPSRYPMLETVAKGANQSGTVPGLDDVHSPNFIDEVAEAMDNDKYDRAVFLLKSAKDNGFESRFINLDDVLREAEEALKRQSYLRDAEREYAPILTLSKHKSTRKLACEAFQLFRKQYPDYDPDNMGALCATVLFPMLEWVEIPAGETTLKYGDRDLFFHVDSFHISKYPVTNAQYQLFINEPDGYANESWWDFSEEALEWRRSHSWLKPKFPGRDHPCANVSWYEAMAFTRWLSAKTGLEITLPNEPQWQRAAQGDEGYKYPWGQHFDSTKCNTGEGKRRQTTPVSQYPEGASPYGVYDMVGNTWEWCVNATYFTREQDESVVRTARAVRGGSVISKKNRANNFFHFYLNPAYRYASIGFRLLYKD